MSKLGFRFSCKEESGILTFDAKYDDKFYKKYGMYSSDRIGCHSEIAYKDARYINWSDKTGFIHSNAYHLPYLCHKRPRKYIHNPAGFDHTSYWRRPGEKWPLFCLTEPYSCGNSENKFIEHITNENEKYIGISNLKFHMYPPSEKSLWVPNSTWMIFWWCPDYFDLESNEKLLFSHEDASEFQKKCEKKIWKIR